MIDENGWRHDVENATTKTELIAAWRGNTSMHALVVDDKGQ